MGNEQKQRAMQILRRFEQADPMTRQADNAAVDMAALLRELIDAPEQAASVPDELPTKEMTAAFSKVFNVRKQRETFGPAVRAMLAAAPEAPAVHADLRDAERYRWLRNDGAGFDISVAEIDDDGHESWVHGYPPEELDTAIDAAIAAEKGGA